MSKKSDEWEHVRSAEVPLIESLCGEKRDVVRNTETGQEKTVWRYEATIGEAIEKGHFSD